MLPDMNDKIADIVALSETFILLVGIFGVKGEFG
jgi:hypothetical protein